MKFSRQKKIRNLAEGRKYQGNIFDINKVRKGEYYEVKVTTSEGIISIWISDSVTPEHPLYSVFDAFIENEEDAKNFDEKDIIGTEIEFTVKNLVFTTKKGEEIERTFFDKVTPHFNDTAEDDGDEE